MLTDAPTHEHSGRRQHNQQQLQVPQQQQQAQQQQQQQVRVQGVGGCLKFERLNKPFKQLRLQPINNHEQRVVMSRPPQSALWNTNQGMIKSLDISRHNIEDEKPRQSGLQFTRHNKLTPKGHSGHNRTRSHPNHQVEQPDDVLADFSNSLENVSFEVIEIPFANKTITHNRLKSQQQKRVQFSRTSPSAFGSCQKGSQQRDGCLRGHVKKISYSKQNAKSHARANMARLQANMMPIPRPKKANIIPMPKKEGHSQANPSLQDFSLRPVKITHSGSIIYMAVHRKTAAIYALKSIRKSKVKLKLSQFLLELKVGLTADHPNILKIYGFFEEGDNVYLVKEYLEEGALVDHRKGLSQALIAQYLNQVIFGVIKLADLVGLENWHFTASQLGKSNGIVKITNLHLSEKGRDKGGGQSFSEQFKRMVECLCESDRRSTFQGHSVQTLACSLLWVHQKCLGEFLETLQKLVIKESTLGLVWDHPFLRQARFKAIMQD